MTNQPDHGTAVSIDGDPLMEAIRYLEADMERFFAEWPDEPRNSPYALGRKDVIAELRRMAAEPAAVGAGAATTPDTEAPRPPRSTWSFEGEYAADKWHGIGNTWSGSVFDDAYERALAEWKERAETDKEHLRLRMLRADTVYTVVAEHTRATPPAGGAPQPKQARP